jgi:type II secretory pathway component GspD/PulD (secretin)
MNLSSRRLGSAVLLASLALSSCLVEPPRHREPFAEPTAPLDVHPAVPIAPPVAPTPPAPVAAKKGEVPVVVSDDKAYSLELRGAELGQAFDLIAGMANLNLVRVGDFSPPVAASFPSVKLQSAIATLCDVHGCTIEKQGDVWRVTRADPAREERRLFQLHNVTAATVEPQLKTLLGDDAVVVTNPSSNVVHVQAASGKLDEAKRYLDAVDQLDKQVLIECQIFEVSQNDLTELGAEIKADNIHFDQTTSTFLSSFFSGTAPTIIATSGNDIGTLSARLEAFGQRLHLKTLSRPKLLSLNNHDAKLEVIQEVPYVQATTSTTGSGTGTGSVTVQQVEFKDVGLKLTLTPAVQEDGHVALHVVQEVSEQTGEFLQIPVVDSRKIDNWFLVKQDDTLRIGGILKDRHQHTIHGIPLLMDIPWLGRVFRFESDTLDQIDLEILITPRLVTSPPPDAKSEVRVEIPKDTPN